MQIIYDLLLKVDILGMKNNVWFVLSEIGQLGFIIAVPVAVFAYFGAKIDKTYHTSPMFLIAGIGLSIFASSLVIYQKIKKIEGK